MGIVYDVPQDVNVQQEQLQQQDQYQGDNILNDYSNNSTESRSKSENRNNLSGSLSNVAIQNNNTGYFQYEREVRIPNTSLNLSVWADDYNQGVQATLSIPLGGRQKKMAYEQVQTRIDENRINNVARQLTACANVDAAGFDIVDYEVLGLEACKVLSKRKVSVPEVTSDYRAIIEEQKAALAKQQLAIQKLLIRIDQLQTENSNPFESNG